MTDDMERIILLGHLKSELAFIEYEKLNLKGLWPLRLEVNHQMAKLIRENEKVRPSLGKEMQE